MQNGPFYGLLCLAELSASNPNQPQPTLPELHLNLWEQGQNVSLDIGLKIERTFNADSVQFWFPWTLVDAQSDIEDLTSRIITADALAAIFNESWTVETVPRQTSATASDPVSRQPVLQVVSPKDYWEFEHLYNDQAHLLKIDLHSLFAQTQQTADNVYLRFRVKNVPRSFYCSWMEQGDRFFISSWSRTEIIDFRINVRRGAPANLENPRLKFLSFSKVHLFLMRERSHELIFQDASFKSCRSLEDEDFWARYTQELGGSHLARRVASKSEDIAKSLGYQWTKKQSPGGKAVDEFSVLARFNRIVVSVRFFLIMALVIGALGNGLWDGIKYLACLTGHFNCQ